MNRTEVKAKSIYSMIILLKIINLLNEMRGRKKRINKEIRTKM